MKNPCLIHDYLTLSADKNPNKAFLICGDKRWTFKQIDRDSSRIAAGLMELDFGNQDKAAVFMDNSAELVTAMYGISKAAGTFVVINSGVKAGKLRYILNNSDTKVLFTQAGKSRIIEEAFRGISNKPTVVCVAPSGKLPIGLVDLCECYRWQTWLNTESAVQLPRAIDQDLAALIYTSGSTGQPKGVMQPHCKMVSVAKNIIEYLDNRPDDVILNVLSMAFGYGMYQVLMAGIFGGTVVIEKSFVYMHNVLKQIAEHGVTGLPLVPTIAAMILKLDKVENYDFSSLRYITNAGAALPIKHCRRLRNLIPDARLFSMYGQTECVRVCYLKPDMIDRRPDSVGGEIPNCRVFVVDENDLEVPPNTPGELVITGSNVMLGYYKDPELTEKVFRPVLTTGQKCLHTGDVFRRDEQGYLYFVSRNSEIIKSRGERISPLEVENYLLEYPAITECAVIGVPDEVFGQAVKAFVVVADGAQIAKNELLKYCTLQMENYMIPKYIEFLPELPRTPNGKVDKKALNMVRPDETIQELLVDE